MLREANAKITIGLTVGQFCKGLCVSDATYCNSRKQHGETKLGQIKRVKQMEKENARLKRLVADLSQDNNSNFS